MTFQAHHQRSRSASYRQRGIDLTSVDDEADAATKNKEVADETKSALSVGGEGQVAYDTTIVSWLKDPTSVQASAAFGTCRFVSGDLLGCFVSCCCIVW